MEPKRDLRSSNSLVPPHAFSFCACEGKGVGFARGMCGIPIHRWHREIGSRYTIDDRLDSDPEGPGRNGVVEPYEARL